MDAFDYRSEFVKFQKTESVLWDPPRREDELVLPSGDLDSPIAHHMHNPSFITLTPRGGETADETNPCVWLIMAAGAFVKGKTLIYDHLARREVVDGLKDYPKRILRCHEEWLSIIRSSMAATVEIAYGRSVHQRMMQTLELEPLRLWGEYADVVIFLEWTENKTGGPKTLARFVIFAMHPQLFLFPWGKKHAAIQDRSLCIAHKLAKINIGEKFYQKLHWSIVNRFPKPAAYPQAKELSRMALKAVQAARETKKDTVPSEPDTLSTNRLIRPKAQCSGLLTEVKTWCIVCRHETVCLNLEVVDDNSLSDTAPQWTKGEPPRYIERMRQCADCAPARTRFIPVDESIPTISPAQLRDFERDHLHVSDEHLLALWGKHLSSTQDCTCFRRPGTWSSSRAKNRILADVDSNAFLLSESADSDMSSSLPEDNPTRVLIGPGIENVPGLSSDGFRSSIPQPTDSLKVSTEDSDGILFDVTSPGYINAATSQYTPKIDPKHLDLAVPAEEEKGIVDKNRWNRTSQKFGDSLL